MNRTVQGNVVIRVRLESQDTAEAEEYSLESELGERGRWERESGME